MLRNVLFTHGKVIRRSSDQSINNFKTILNFAQTVNTSPPIPALFSVPLFISASLANFVSIMLSRDIKIRSRQSASSQTTQMSSDSRAQKSEIRAFMKKYSASTEEVGLQVRDWLIVLVELFVSFAWICIRQRRRVIEHLMKKNLTEKAEHIDFLFWEGWVAVGNIVVGCIIDSYISCYAAALFTVVYHFLMSSIIFMESVAMLYEKDNPYDEVLPPLVTLSIVVLKSTDFTRLVFGLENLETRKKSKIFLFLFMFTWVGGRVSDGGALWIITSLLEFSPFRIACASFCLGGISLYLFVYPLRPMGTTKARRGLAFDVLGCICAAAIRKCRHRSPRKKHHWIDNADSLYDRLTIMKTKEMVKLIQKLSPTIGFVFYVVNANTHDLFHTALVKLKPTGLFWYTGISQGIPLSILSTMLVTQFVVLPLFKVLDIASQFHSRFLLGYLVALFSMFYVATVLIAIESHDYGPSIGHIRIFNLRHKNVQFTTRDPDFSLLNYSADPSQSILIKYTTAEATLFKVSIKFDEEISWQTHLSVTPSSVTGYILAEPAEILRVGRSLPVMEGPPGTNDLLKARIYIFNSIRRYSETVSIITYAKRELAKEITVVPGKVEVFQLPEGKYFVFVKHRRRVEILDMGAGGVYGVILHAEGISIDKTVPTYSHSSALAIGFVIPAGIAFTLAYVALKAVTFLGAPTGLLGVSFAFLSFIEYSTAWINFIGFKTWHPFPTAQMLFTYSFFVALCFFFTMFIFIKCKAAYSW